MIYTNLRNIINLDVTHPGIKAAIEYMKFNDLQMSSMGKTVINDDVYFTKVSSLSNSFDLAKFEGHEDYIDIHILLRGTEDFYCAHKEDIAVTKSYDKDLDVKYGSSSYYQKLQLRPWDVVVCNNYDFHQSGCSEVSCHIDKIIFKIKK